MAPASIESHAWQGNGGTSANSGNLWSDSGFPWHPIICDSSDPGGATYNTNPGYAPCPLFQVAPMWLNANGSWSGGQSGHTAVVNVGLGDGSVRTVSGSLSAASWAQACDPRDGIPLGSDW